MRKDIRYVGLDVHAETISAAVAEADGEVRWLGTISNRPEAVSRFVKKLGAREALKICYEAGPTGYVLYWQLTRMGVACTVVAPSLIPTKPGDRVKTDRRDAEKLARAFRSGDLTAVWVPDEAHEALRDLVRAREDATQDRLRARHRLQKFLLRQGRRAPEGMKSSSQKQLEWVKAHVHFDQPAQEATLVDYLHEVEHGDERIARLERAIEDAVGKAPERMRAVIQALQSLRGVAGITATTIVSEVGDLRRFLRPRQLMGYCGLVSSECSTGSRTRRGSITKTGNAHLRRVIVETAWCYRHRPTLGATLKRRQQGQSEEVKQIAWKAQHRLHSRFWRLQARGKPSQQVATAIARELLGFVWAIGVKVESAPVVSGTTRRKAA